LRAWYQQKSVLLLITFTTILLFLVIVLAVSRYISLEKLVALRTKDLYLANKNLEFELEERKRLEKENLIAREEEQRRIGQDLHDGIVQRLTGIEYISNWYKNKLQNQEDNASQTVDEICNELHQSITEIEDIARGLNPQVLETHGLAEALQELATRTRSLFLIDCQYHGLPRIPIHDTMSCLQLYRIAQESINNAVKHADPQSIQVNVRENDGHLCLEIQDDGNGFPSPNTTSSGMGLKIMEYRARLLGAELQIHSLPHQGTTIICILPQRGNHE
jgi:two-component system CheB/CheR fusion protein